MREQDIIQSVAPFFEEIEKFGYEVLATSDFDRILHYIPETGRKTQTPMMAIDRQDFARSESFWLLLLKDGKAVAGAGAKYVDLEDEPIETYLQRTSRGQYGRDSDPLLSVSRPVRDYVRGRLIYLGELEFHPDHRGNKDLLEAFVKVLQGLAAVKWRNFDWMYVFIDEDHLRFAHIYDFQITVRDAITWAEPVPAGRLNTHCLMATEGRHIGHVLRSAKARLMRRRFSESSQKPG